MKVENKTTVETVKKESRIILFCTAPSISEGGAEVIQELERVTGMHEADIRFKLFCQGIGMFPIQSSLEEAEHAVLHIQKCGIRAVAVNYCLPINQKSLPLAKSISLTPLYIVFKDDRLNPILTIDRTSDILIVLADLSGIFRDFALSEMAYKGEKQIPFQNVLNKAAPFVFQPVADIFLINSEPAVRGVRIDSRQVVYTAWDEPSQGAGNKFIRVIRRIMLHAQNCYTDHYFGLANLPGAKPDKHSYKNDKQGIARMLMRYESYIQTAAVSGLLLPETRADLMTESISSSANSSQTETQKLFLPETGLPDEKGGNIMPILARGFIASCVLALPFMGFMKRGMSQFYLTSGAIAAFLLVVSGLAITVFMLTHIKKQSTEKKLQELTDNGLPDKPSEIFPSWVMKLLLVGGLCIIGFGIVLMMRLKFWQYL